MKASIKKAALLVAVALAGATAHAEVDCVFCCFVGALGIVW